MGTSKSYGGPGSGLVPSWVDDTAAPATTGGAETADAAVPEQSTTPSGQPVTAGTSGFTGARRMFSNFARTGNSSALGWALKRHVGSSGGPKKAARRMAAARSTGGALLGFVRDAARSGVDEALRIRGLQHLAGQSAETVFMGLIEVICPPGGPIDEAIARQALLDAIADQVESGMTEFDALSSEQLNEFFLDFIIRSIEGRIMSDIGARGVTLPDDVGEVIALQEQLHDFVAGCCRSHLAAELGALDSLTDRQLDRKIEAIYEAAFTLIADAGDVDE